MSYAPGAPPSVWAVTGISDGAKITLLHWWGKADHEVQREPRVTTVWAPAAFDGERRLTPAASLLEDLRRIHPGKADRTLRGYFAELARAGLARVEGRCIELTPPELAEPERRESATPRQDPATARRKSAGENLPDTGEIPPGTGENLPKFGEIPPSQLNPPVPPDPPMSTHSGPRPSRPRGDRAPEQAALAGLDPGAEGQPARASSPPKAAALGEAVDAILADHERLRGEAYAAHGERPRAWPRKGSKADQSMRSGLRAALVAHGEETCRRVLAWRSAQWLADPSQLAWSTSWTKPSVDGALARMSRAEAGPGARAGGREGPRRVALGCDWSADAEDPRRLFTLPGGDS